MIQKNKSVLFLYGLLTFILVISMGFLALLVNTTDEEIPASTQSTSNTPLSAFKFTQISPTAYNVSLADKTLKEVEVPSEYNGLAVTEIATNGFLSCANLEKVIIPSSVRKIGSAAFMNCTKLKTVNMASVEAISQNAFAMCSKLDNVILPKTVTTVGATAFRNFSGTVYTRMPFEATSGWTNWLSQFSGNVEYDYPGVVYDEITENDVVTAYSVRMFQAIDKSDLNIIIDEHNNLPVREIPMLAFLDCVLNSLTIGVNASSSHTINIQGNAFTNSNIPNIGLGDRVTFEDSPGIPAEGVFSDSGVVQVRLPSTLNAILPSMFQNCYNLTSINFTDDLDQNNRLPANITKIGEFAFQDCVSMRSLFIPSSVAEIGNNAFTGWMFFEDEVISIDLTETQVDALVDSGDWHSFWNKNCGAEIIYKSGVADFDITDIFVSKINDDQLGFSWKQISGLTQIQYQVHCGNDTANYSIDTTNENGAVTVEDVLLRYNNFCDRTDLLEIRISSVKIDDTIYDVDFSFTLNPYFAEESTNAIAVITSIRHLDNIRFFSDQVQLVFSLEADLDLSGILWSPIMEFKSTFLGNFHTIANVMINHEVGTGFIHHNAGTIQNLYFKCVGIVNNASDMTLYASSLFCYENYGVIKDCDIKAEIDDFSFLDNLYGFSIVCVYNGGRISNCYLEAYLPIITIDANFLEISFVSIHNWGSIIGCFVDGQIEVSGIINDFVNATFISIYNYYSGLIRGCGTNGSITIDVAGGFTSAAAFICITNGSTVYGYGLENCVADGLITVTQQTGYCLIGGIVAQGNAKNCRVRVVISTYGHGRAGAIAGEANYLESCIVEYSTINVNGTGDYGLVAGYICGHVRDIEISHESSINFTGHFNNEYIKYYVIGILAGRIDACAIIENSISYGSSTLSKGNLPPEAIYAGNNEALWFYDWYVYGKNEGGIINLPGYNWSEIYRGDIALNSNTGLTFYLGNYSFLDEGTLFGIRSAAEEEFLLVLYGGVSQGSRGFIITDEYGSPTNFLRLSFFSGWNYGISIAIEYNFTTGDLNLVFSWDEAYGDWWIIFPSDIVIEFCNL